MSPNPIKLASSSKAGHLTKQQFVYTTLSLYGKSAAEVETIRAEWEPWLRSVLGVDDPPAVKES